MLKWDRNNKHQSLYDPNPYRIENIKGNMIMAKRPDHQITRNSRFFKLISEQCYTEALKLLDSIPKQNLDPVLMTFLKNAQAPTTVSTASNNMVNASARQAEVQDGMVNAPARQAEVTNMENALARPAKVPKQNKEQELRPPSTRSKKTYVHFDEAKHQT